MMCLQFADRVPIDMHAWFRFLLILPGRLTTKRRFINSLNITHFHLTHLHVYIHIGCFWLAHSQNPRRVLCSGYITGKPRQRPSACVACRCSQGMTPEILAKPSSLCRYHYLPCVLRLLDWLAKINKKHKDPRKNVTAMMWASSFSLKRSTTILYKFVLCTCWK